MNKSISWGDCWHDATLERIIIEYNDIIIEIEREEIITKLRCSNFLGIKYLGQWDENVINRIYSTYDYDIIQEAKKNVAQHNDTKNLGGGVRNFDTEWICVNLELIDGVVIQIVCDNIEYQSDNAYV